LLSISYTDYNSIIESAEDAKICLKAEVCYML